VDHRRHWFCQERRTLGRGARQYCGRLGKTDNCQVAVSLSLANRHASLPVAYQLYLPEEWSNDRKRLRKAGVPEDVGFKTKPEIALEQIAAACAAGLPRGAVLTDAAYGNNSDVPPGRSRHLPFPTVSDPEAPPL
jgi:SRSO17 transposase